MPALVQSLLIALQTEEVLPLLHPCSYAGKMNMYKHVFSHICGCGECIDNSVSID